jgi:hypothetical protein
VNAERAFAVKKTVKEPNQSVMMEIYKARGRRIAALARKNNCRSAHAVP